MSDDDPTRTALDEILTELRSLRLETENQGRDLAHLRRAYGTVSDELARLRAPHSPERCELRGSVLLRQLGRACLNAATPNGNGAGEAL